MADLNQTPSANRVHIAFFGKRNAGKSSVVNAVTGQNISIVSDVKGTTTDPVQKAMELLPLGPVVIIDTPGMDDEGRAPGRYSIKLILRCSSSTARSAKVRKTSHCKSSSRKKACRISSY